VDIDNANLRRKPVNDRDPPSMDDLREWVEDDQHDHVKDAFERFELPTTHLLHKARSGAMVDLLVSYLLYFAVQQPWKVNIDLLYDDVV
jgi:hypothetical protein